MSDSIKHLESKYVNAHYELIIACEARELQLYLFLKLHAINKHSCFPSWTTFQKQLGWSSATVAAIIKKMEAKKRLKIERNIGKNSVYDITWYDLINDSDYFRNQSSTTLETKVPTTLETKVERIITKTNNTLRVVKPTALQRKPNQIFELTERFFQLKGWDIDQRIMTRYFVAAKNLLALVNGDTEAAVKKLEQLKTWADAKKLDWTIDTAIKRFNAVESEQTKKPFIDGDEAYQKNGKWFVISNGKHLEYGGVSKPVVVYR